MGHEALEDALGKYLNEDLAAKKDDVLVCACFGVTKNHIIEAIKDNNLKTVEEVTNYTKAGGACGNCRGSIQGIIGEFYHNEPKVEKVVLTKTQNS